MTSEEKLRVLLIEARVWVATSEPTMLMRLGIGWSEQKKLLAGIDAALSEPVTLTDCARKGCEYQRVAEEFGVALTNVAKERDEARAEVERLRYALKGMVNTCRLDCTAASHCGVCAIAFRALPLPEEKP